MSSRTPPIEHSRGTLGVGMAHMPDARHTPDAADHVAASLAHGCHCGHGDDHHHAAPGSHGSSAAHVHGDGHGHGHGHVFLGTHHQGNTHRVWLVLVLTAGMMVLEIVAGHLYGSMALVADGWHMATHAGAMLLAALAYHLARKHAHNPRFTFGTGKLGDLAGFASAIALALVAVLIGWESLQRLANPVPIHFGQAMGVAVLGLGVNLLSAWLLGGGHHHHHDHDHDHDHPAAQDNNLRAAYLHVLADALTSVLAIVALLLGRSQGWLWADPVMGLVGAVVIARWSWGLVRDAGSVLLDAAPQCEAVRQAIIRAIAPDVMQDAQAGDRITDLHVWQVGPGHFAAIVAVASASGQDVVHYRARLSHIHALSHITLEVLPA